MSTPLPKVPAGFDLTPTYMLTITAIFCVVLGSIIYIVYSIAPDPAAPAGRWSGSGRIADKLWFTWFLIHIPVTILIDCQSLYPPSLVPEPLRLFLQWYLDYSRDPVLIGAYSGSREWAWITTFLHMELFIQLPCFIIGAIGLWKNDKRVYPIILMYGALTATTVVPIIYYIWTEVATPPLTQLDRFVILGTYIPFLLIPAAMVADMLLKLVNLVAMAQRAGAVSVAKKNA